MDRLARFDPFSFLAPFNGPGEDVLGRLASISRDDRMSVRKSSSGWQIEIEAPGMDKKDFKVEIGVGAIDISVPASAERHSSRLCRGFKRTLALPKMTNKEKVNASYVAGILRIDVPCLTEQSITQRRTIEVE